MLHCTKNEWTPQKNKQTVGKEYRLRIHHWQEMLKAKATNVVSQIEVDLTIPTKISDSHLLGPRRELSLVSVVHKKC